MLPAEKKTLTSGKAEEEEGEGIEEDLEISRIHAARKRVSHSASRVTPAAHCCLMAASMQAAGSRQQAGRRA